MQRHLHLFARLCARCASVLPWVITTPLFAASAPATPAADAIALAIVFDTSGSMQQSIATKPGSPPAPKIVIARRAFGTVIDRLEAFTQGPTAKPLLVGITIFRGNDAVVALPLAPFNAAKLRTWAGQVTANGATPLGAAMFLAGRDLLSVPASSRHILVLTDGENTAGPKPEKVLTQIAEASARKQAAVFTHIIALDLKPDVFTALQKQGATLIGATDETQLNQQFEFILEDKILVEAPRAAR
jgi:Ca-activated chloride channel homolog